MQRIVPAFLVLAALAAALCVAYLLLDGDGDDAAPERLVAGEVALIGEGRPEPPAPAPSLLAPAPAAAEPVPAGAAPEREAVAAPPVPRDLAGSVVDDTGAPVGRFRLLGRFRSSGSRTWEERELGTFAGGRFELPELEEGRWKLRAEGDGLWPAGERAVRVPAKDEVELRVVRVGTLAGRVVDPHGEPVAGADVRTGGASGAPRSTTDDEGRFAVALPEGAFEVVARDGRWAPSAPLEGVLGRGESRADLVLALRQGGRIEGRVLDDEGRPLAGWWVKAWPTSWVQDRPVVPVDASGAFAIEHLAPGTYSVNAVEEEDDNPGSTPLREVVEVRLDETTTIVLGGERPDSIVLSGTVTHRGEPAVGMVVWTMNEGRESYSTGATARTDEEGAYELTLARPGPTMLLVAAGSAGGVPGAALYHIDVPAGADHEHDVELPEGRIFGRVRGGGRKVVRARPLGRNPVVAQFLSRSTKADREGEFAFESMAAGTWRVSLLSAVGPGASTDVTLASDTDAVAVDLELAGTGDVVVHVRDGSGDPVSGAKVYAHDVTGAAHGAGRNLATDRKGAVRFRNLESGSWRFFARGDEAASLPSESVQVATDGRAEVELVLAPGAWLDVTALGADGEPAESTLTVRDAEGREFAALADEIDFSRYLSEGYSSSTRRIGPLPAGTYAIEARLEGLARKAEVHVAAGETLEVVLDE